MNDLISVIIPTYNRADLIKNAIQSVLDQTYTNWELIIVDDGSTDNTKEVVDEYIKKDLRIKYFYKENGGQGSARNVAIKNASGKWILPLDSDDVLLPSGMYRLLSSAIEGNSDLVWGKTWRIFWGSKKIIGIGGAAPSSVLLKKDIFDKYGLYEENREFLEDVDHLYRLQPFMDKGEVILLKIKTPVSIYFVHKGQETSLLNPKYLLMKANGMINRWDSDDQKTHPHYLENMGRWWRNKGSYEIFLNQKEEGITSLKRSISLRPNLSSFVLLFLASINVSVFKFFVLFTKKVFEFFSFKISFFNFFFSSDRIAIWGELHSILKKIN